MNKEATSRMLDDLWERSIVPQLIDYIRIPNKSPHFDARWAEHGHMDRAVALIENWCRAQPIDGLCVEVVRLPGRTPLIFMEVPGDVRDRTVLVYGHLDKQPEMTGWGEGLGPWNPVRRGDRLYGRGGADDGYAAFAALAAILALREQHIPHARCVVIIEACEESGSFDLPAYIDALAPRIGEPSLVVCLDTGCLDYEGLWSTSSLRGNITGTLSVEILQEGVHSGAASGIAPSSFRIVRCLLDRLEDARTGEILLRELHVEIPEERLAQARALGAALPLEALSRGIAFVEGARAVSEDPVELILGGTWRPTLSVTGAGGLPSIGDAGNVLRPFTALKLSIRTPPTADAVHAAAALKNLLEADPPYGARIQFECQSSPSGWNAPPLASWLVKATDRASHRFFGRRALSMGQGGTIPFIAMLGRRFPQAQFLITGVLGPGSNAHGPNEFIDIGYAKRLTACVAQIIGDQARHAG